MSAHEALREAARAALDAGHTLPCLTDRGALWLSDDHEQRAEAANRCRRSCPVIPECATAAASTRERFGVWGGVDRTPKKPKVATT